MSRASVLAPCSDALCDTTPAVRDFISGLSGACALPSSDDGTGHDSHCGPRCLQAMGHVFLTSLLCVSRLARKRQLLLRRLERHAAPPSPSADTTTDHTAFVRLVLSLLEPTKVAQATTAPCASAPGDDGAPPEAAPLPWWAATSAPSESAQDVVYTALCVGDNAELRQENAPDGSLARLTTAHCRIVLRSIPVPTFSAATTDELTLDAELGASAISKAGDDGRAPDASRRAGVNAEAAADVCVARALKDFDACVRHHEEACLRQIAEVVGSLQQLLEQPATEVGRTGEVASKDVPPDGAVGDVSQLGSCTSPLHEWTVDVPIYGVVLRIEDTQATRLKRVRRLTTPLLQAATGCGDVRGGPLGPVTQVLTKLHTWCTASRTAASSPSSASLGTPSCTPALPTLTCSQVKELRQLIARLLEDSQGAAAASPPGPANPTTVSYSAPRVSVAPACVVHCQLGVSRSPSVVMLFYMDMLAPQLRAAASAAAEPLAIFNGLLGALVRARRQVRPNVCFAAQLISLWQQLMQPDTPVGLPRVN
ncbi:hypothetical protein JIQ42_07479 [Leishmania sp. Namibia]|uniref:hypothetical protein n=1 Tax=Leishmania sp. Namibia TaxID=2802991 RepID=UPI001B6060D6|nr:hypothetical protein JIQ42_07479 [Leishmania sp. Namibia]